ncbi:MAG: family 10 glycosylhydrolase [Chthoniobacter sp.]|uniref:family 10 glycosylhydrolase n=1 Tax=Chthoniobacter sp. TaxID=2510640 RepID=UPI0032A5C2DE
MKQTLLATAALLLAPLLPTRAAEPPQPRHGEKLIINNDDGFSSFYSGRYKSAEDLHRHVLTFRDTQLAVFEWCISSGSRANYPTKATELVGEGVTDFGRKGDQLAAETLHRLAAEGTDTLQVVAAACHEAGVACYASLRMNGDYGAKLPDDSLSRLFNSDFWRAHPEFRIRGPKGEDKIKLSYAFPEVQAFKLGILREVVTRDIDGINLDFLRHPPFFGFEEPLRQAFEDKYHVDPTTVPVDDPRWSPLRAELMTRFVRDVRHLLDEEGQRKHRHLGLSARVDWKEYQTLGCDIETWLHEGLLDYLVIAQHSLGGYEIDLAPFVRMAQGTGCAILYGEEGILSGHDRTAAEDKLIAEGKLVPPKSEHLTLEQYQARAARWYAAGAAGVHLFNEGDHHVMSVLGSVKATPPPK